MYPNRRTQLAVLLLAMFPVLACQAADQPSPPPSAIAGISRVAAYPDHLELEFLGLTSAVEIVELSPFQDATNAASAPAIGTIQCNGFTRSVLPRFETNGTARRDRIYSGFIARPRVGGTVRAPVGPIRYVEEWNGISRYEQPFPLASSKKGLQVQMLDDALALGVRHAALNLNLTALIDWQRNTNNPSWELDGETYYFHRNQLDGLGVKQLTGAGAVASLIILTYASGRAEIDRVMLHPKYSTNAPNRLGAFNTSTPDGLRHFKAAMEFLADWFSRPDGAHGRVANYILGNEVNSHWHWYNMGRATPDEVIDDYLRAIRVANTAVRKASSSARVYLSLEHHWNIAYEKDQLRTLPGRKLIDEFNRRAKEGGDFDWHLAFHPYPENLFKPKTWLDKSALPNADTPRITFKNLEQLTAYLHRSELLYHGQPRRIILSEQGFHSDATPEGELAQAAAYCYAWQKVAGLDGIDAFILHRHVDHKYEGGLNLGLWRRKPDSVATPGARKPIYDIFLKADTPERDEAFRFALPIIGITNWSQVSGQTATR